MNAVVTGALSGEERENQSRFIKRVTLALISIPIWLIIVLLSPLDAYAAETWFGMTADRLPYLGLAEAYGLGTAVHRDLPIKHVTV